MLSPHLVLTRGDPKPPGNPQEQTPVNNPHIEVRLKAQLSFRGGETKEKIKTLSPATKAAENPHTPLGRFNVYGIIKGQWVFPQKKRALILKAVDIGGKKKARLESKLCPLQVQRPTLESLLGRWRWAFAQSGGKDGGSWASRRACIIILKFYFIL